MCYKGRSNIVRSNTGRSNTTVAGGKKLGAKKTKFSLVRQFSNEGRLNANKIKDRSNKKEQKRSKTTVITK